MTLTVEANTNGVKTMNEDIQAVVYVAPAMHYFSGREGTIELSVDASGPCMSFINSEGEARQMTMDDAMFAHEMYSTPKCDLLAKWNEVCETEYVFEGGAFIEYEGMYNSRFFRSYTAAVAHAKAVGDEWAAATVLAHPIVDAKG